MDDEFQMQRADASRRLWDLMRHAAFSLWDDEKMGRLGRDRQPGRHKKRRKEEEGGGGKPRRPEEEDEEGDRRGAEEKDEEEILTRTWM